ncbi:ras guanine nucleotide exchange factor domain-containing protein [Entophlyctis helioformis]|nr:ras guanine nucleotide exchange factor domain-containing protein [Entophlyctis helioformis]
MIQAPTQPRELTPAELKEWHDLKLTPIRLRVFNVIKSWIENYLGGDAEDLQALDLAREFADTKMKKYLPTASAQLLRLIDRRRENGPNAVTRLLTANNRDFPSPILPKNIRRFRFLDLDPLELARQLTLLESELFASIQPSEFLSKAWSAEKGRPSTFVHVNALISLSNNISSWVAATILGEPDLRKRAKTMSQFITIAEKCSMLNNYNGLVSILGSLDSAHIHRLKKTWEQVPGRQLAIYDQLRDIMSPTRNFSNYRTALRSVNPPCVPFLGCYLTDLTFIADGNPDVIKGRSNLINFGKMAKTADVLREVQQFQHVKYTLIKVPEIQDFLESVLVDDSSVSEFYDMSLQLEPRNDS